MLNLVSTYRTIVTLRKFRADAVRKGTWSSLLMVAEVLALYRTELLALPIERLLGNYGATYGIIIFNLNI